MRPEHTNRQVAAGPRAPRSAQAAPVEVALLTGGDDRPYVYGLATALASKGVRVDVIGSDFLDCEEFHRGIGVNFLNLRGDQDPHASVLRKITRVSAYYARLLSYAATAKPRIFHILWNNKFQTVDRTLLMLYYKLMGKRIVFTAHNVNAARRDGKDTPLNRLTLRIQYLLADHIFVHNEKMKSELVRDFAIGASKISVIPLGINNSAPRTSLTPAEAKQRLGLRAGERAILFFGLIKPYKGLEYLTAAFQEILSRSSHYRLIIAGATGEFEDYWKQILESIRPDVGAGRVLAKPEFISEDETEVYFKAADVLVLPYRQIYESGVLFLGYSFGLPVLASHVGSLADEVVESKTGYLFRPEDSVDLARAIERYFASDLYANLNERRDEIKEHAARRHSWDTVAQVTVGVYARMVQLPCPADSSTTKAKRASYDIESSL